uniref:Uncharacterized protein n=1 Tax=mine drainage metagenome TaxID=410659 RepID=E6PH33_9ZZZZ
MVKVDSIEERPWPSTGHLCFAKDRTSLLCSYSAYSNALTIGNSSCYDMTDRRSFLRRDSRT